MDKFKLVVFDVDGTLLDIDSSWQHLHEKFGTWDKGKQYSKRFYQRLITYEQWARMDASLWRDLSVKRVQRIIDDIPYTKGAKEAVISLRKRGIKIVLLSAGLNLVLKKIERDVEVDYSLANDLVINNGFLTGEVKINVPFQDKGRILSRILRRFKVKNNECAAVGDDETMISLFNIVGLGVAFNPKSDLVEKWADVVIRRGDLIEILPHLLIEN